jgi:CubicO group peptidase (beta-lactamase class C family)
VRVLLILSLLLWASEAVSQPASPLSRITELNRSGAWQEAMEESRKFLNSPQTQKPVDRCEALYHLTYAQTRLGSSAEGGGSLADYDRECGTLKGHWLEREVAKLREELRPQPGVTPPIDNFWQTAAASELGLDPAALEEHGRLCERSGADACLVIRRGKIAQEYYSPRYRVPMLAMSSTKSVTGLLVGMLLDEGKIPSIDEPVCSYVPQWCDGLKRRATIRHLLTMTSGLPRMYDDGLPTTNDKNAFVAALPLSVEPGTRWTYSNEGVQLLSPILDKAAGEPIQEYAHRRLFAPLGMTETRLHLDALGHAWTYADMETTARDFARLGLLMLNRGTWNGKQIVSDKWIMQSVAPSQSLFAGYGLLWWLHDRPRGFRADGYLDTNLYVFPEQDLIVVRMQARPVETTVSYSQSASAIFERLTK